MVTRSGVARGPAIGFSSCCGFFCPKASMVHKTTMAMLTTNGAVRRIFMTTDMIVERRCAASEVSRRSDGSVALGENLGKQHWVDVAAADHGYGCRVGRKLRRVEKQCGRRDRSAGLGDQARCGDDSAHGGTDFGFCDS